MFPMEEHCLIFKPEVKKVGCSCRIYTVAEESVEELKQEVGNKVCPSLDSGENAGDILPA
jgi:hypothetical protein